MFLFEQVDSLATTINRSNLELNLSTLEELCQAQELHCYGMEVVAAPYCYHKPSSRAASSGATLPVEMECRAGRNLPHLDVFMYPISPTTRIPATYPFLDPDPEEAQFIPGGKHVCILLYRHFKARTFICHSAVE